MSFTLRFFAILFYFFNLQVHAALPPQQQPQPEVQSQNQDDDRRLDFDIVRNDLSCASLACCTVAALADAMLCATCFCGLPTPASECWALIAVQNSCAIAGTGTLCCMECPNCPLVNENNWTCVKNGTCGVWAQRRYFPDRSSEDFLTQRDFGVTLVPVGSSSDFDYFIRNDHPQVNELKFLFAGEELDYVPTSLDNERRYKFLKDRVQFLKNLKTGENKDCPICLESVTTGRTVFFSTDTHCSDGFWDTKCLIRNVKPNGDRICSICRKADFTNTLIMAKPRMSNPLLQEPMQEEVTPFALETHEPSVFQDQWQDQRME